MEVRDVQVRLGVKTPRSQFPRGTIRGQRSVEVALAPQPRTSGERSVRRLRYDETDERHGPQNQRRSTNPAVHVLILRPLAPGGLI